MRLIYAALALAQIRWSALDLARAAYLTECAEEAYPRAAERRRLSGELMARAVASR